MPFAGVLILPIFSLLTNKPLNFTAFDLAMFSSSTSATILNSCRPSSSLRLISIAFQLWEHCQFSIMQLRNLCQL